MKRTLLWSLYAVYLVAVGYLVWNPQPTVPSQAVYRVSDLLDTMGFTARPDFVEFGLNVLLFIPMSLIGVFVLRRLRIADWVLLAFCASFVIELAQKFFLPARSADARDVVSNTLGALIGALIARPILLWQQRRTPAVEPVETTAPPPLLEPPVVGEPAQSSPVVEEPAKPASRNRENPVVEPPPVVEPVQTTTPEAAT